MDGDLSAWAATTGARDKTRSGADYAIIGYLKYLTGEADALSYRILCDLTAAGRDLVCEAYGIRPEGLAENWNCGDKSDPHVASIMLAHDAWRQIGPVRSRWSRQLRLPGTGTPWTGLSATASPGGVGKTAAAHALASGCSATSVPAIRSS